MPRPGGRGVVRGNGYSAVRADVREAARKGETASRAVPIFGRTC